MLKRIAIAFAGAIVLAGCEGSPDDSAGDFPNATQQSEVDIEVNTPATQTERGPFEFQGPRTVITEGSLLVDVMQLVPPRRAIELTKRLQEAARQNPEWFLEHVSRAEPGKPLPYDSRLGLSELEYKEFLALAKEWTTQKTAEAMLLVSSGGNDVYVLDGGQALPDLTGIEIDLQHDLVRTPFGTTTERSEIHAPEHSALGAGDGVQWRLDVPGPDVIPDRVVNLALGRLKRSGRCVLYYDVKKFGSDGLKRITYTLYYDLPAR